MCLVLIHLLVNIIARFVLPRWIGGVVGRVGVAPWQEGPVLSQGLGRTPLGGMGMDRAWGNLPNIRRSERRGQSYFISTLNKFCF